VAARGQAGPPAFIDVVFDTPPAARMPRHAQRQQLLAYGVIWQICCLLFFHFRPPPASVRGGVILLWLRAAVKARTDAMRIIFRAPVRRAMRAPLRRAVARMLLPIDVTRGALSSLFRSARLRPRLRLAIAIATLI
jgi:hypothetical protein